MNYILKNMSLCIKNGQICGKCARRNHISKKIYEFGLISLKSYNNIYLLL